MQINVLAHVALSGKVSARQDGQEESLVGESIERKQLSTYDKN